MEKNRENNGALGWIDQPLDGPKECDWPSLARSLGLPPTRPQQPVCVFMRQTAIAAVRAHCAQHAVEVGGVLFGQAYRLGQQIVVDVTAAIPAIGARSSPSHLEFTPAGWEAVFAARAALPEHAEVVGWYHSHPGLGVFLSSTDLKSHRDHFSQPWMLALVVDPIACQEGAFVGGRGESVGLTWYSGIPERAQPEAGPGWLQACRRWLRQWWPRRS